MKNSDLDTLLNHKKKLEAISQKLKEHKDITPQMNQQLEQLYNTVLERITRIDANYSCYG